MAGWKRWLRIGGGAAVAAALAAGACAPGQGRPGAEGQVAESAEATVSDTGRGYDAVTTEGVDGEAQVDNTGKGAVLCARMLYIAAEQVGRQCAAGQDAAFQQELTRSLSRIDRFIIANSSQPVTQAQLDAARAREQAQNRRHVKLCEGDMLGLYQAIRAQGPQAMRTSVDDLLSIPREPVLNPCL